ncbi:hypothetical protein HANVADRAFT_1099 [Hanseniaspora valbyensis NRRL Y-1626]|uniref:Anaphase-promoting complex subunit 5 n=1 Tax=Hanseniaspora valbyensis NRRL Y-1626 TaxID=766949 RepID=A0A1B7TH08_9ASCO|nr:hypothetical protein HANVADRAFT_1099 [Hanseniaspora valbyensis NRRL Y-1626]
MDVLLDYHNIGYLKPKYIFILTLLLLYVDSDINSCLRPYETDIMQFFYKPDDNFKEKEDDDDDDFDCLVSLIKPFFDNQTSNLDFRNILTYHAIPLFTEILSDINYLNNMIYILLKKKNTSSNYGGKKQKLILLEHSIFGSFLICCSTIIKDNLSTQEKINKHILQKRLYKLSFLLPFSIGPEDKDNPDFQSYKHHSNTYKFIKNDFQIDYEEHKKSFIKFNVNHYLLQEMLPSAKDTSSLLQNNHIPPTSLIQDIHSKNFQDSQDTLFEELDSCETQYQMIMIMLAMVNKHLYCNNLQSVVESLSLIIESSRTNKNKFLLTLSFVLFYILLNKYPEMRFLSNMKLTIIKQIDDFFITSDYNLILNSLGAEIAAKFLCAKVLNFITIGDFNQAFKIIKKIELLNLQLDQRDTKKNSYFSIKENSDIFPITYEETLKIFHSSLISLHLKEPLEYKEEKNDYLKKNNNENKKNSPCTKLTIDTVYQSCISDLTTNFKCHEFILQMSQRSFLLNSEQISMLKQLETAFDTSQDEVYLINYILINNMIKNSCIETAISSIDNILQEVISKNIFYWEFEFNLLKCIVYSKHNGNKNQVLKLYDNIFFKNNNDKEYYYKKLDRYKKLLIQVHYNFFKIESGLVKDQNFIIEFCNDLKYEIAKFPHTRLSELWYQKFPHTKYV